MVYSRLRCHSSLLIAIVILELVSIANTQVVSNLCPDTCVNRTCMNPDNGIFTCSYGCVDGYWGGRCINDCPSECLTCHQSFRATEECYSCVHGYYFTDSDKSCSKCPQGCATCSSASECTTCTTGYYNTTLSAVCNQCPASCTACSSATNCAQCNTGFTGNTCEECMEGRYGANCASFCPSTCQACSSFAICTVCKEGYYNSGQVVTGCSLTSPPCPSTCAACTSSTDCTACVNGYYNTVSSRTCNNECPNGCVACTSATSCTSCKPNFTGFLCDKCIQGRFGSHCDQTCPANCVSCSSASMCNECSNSYYNGNAPNGDNTTYNDCRLSCPNSCGSCTSYTLCNTCRQHFSGTTCSQCVDGRYGTNCDRLCPSNCLNGRCDRSSGYCVACQQNFSGNTCDECEIGTHGSNCDQQCSPGCKDKKCGQYTGHCTYRCINSNVQGDKCDSCVDDYYGSLCDKCIPGKYGQSCDQNCPVNCQGKVCQRENGSCISCAPGYFGFKCESRCSSNCYNNLCDQSNGHCSQGCKVEFSGDKCCLNNKFCRNCSTNYNCQVCVSGKYGQWCELSCSNCNHMDCEQEYGYCFGCNGNFHGPKCDKACPPWCMDSDNEDNTCYPDNGHCTGNCLDGYHGEMCEKTCSFFCLNQTCDKNEGSCKLGCVPGRTGTFCITVIEKEHSPGAWPIVGTVVGVVFGIVICVLLLLNLLRYKRPEKTTKPQPPSNEYDSINMAVLKTDGYLK